MAYTALSLLVIRKGVAQVQIPESVRGEVLREAGRHLFQDGQYEEAGKAFLTGALQDELIASGDWLAQQGRCRDAAYFYRGSSDAKRMESCAHACLREGFLQQVKMLFEVLGNKNMLRFLYENFGV